MKPIITGLDIGNGYTKVRSSLGSKLIEFDSPSAVSYIMRDAIPAPKDGAFSARGVLADHDLTITSGAISAVDEGRIAVGERALKSGRTIRAFDIASSIPKCDDPLSVQLALSHLAAAALELTDSTNAASSADHVIAVSLPIEDYLAHRRTYAHKLKGEHTVRVHGYTKPLDVRVNIVRVEVIAEGASAQYALSSFGADFMAHALDLARGAGQDISADYTGDLLHSARNTIGIDVGEGTTNLVVFTDGDVNVEASTSIDSGWGTVLEEVQQVLRDYTKGLSRKSLGDFLVQTDLVGGKKVGQARAREVAERHARALTSDVAHAFSEVFRRVGLMCDAVFVYGGGAGNIQAQILPRLTEIARVGGQQVPVIYLDSNYSRILGVHGLHLAATAAAKLVV